MVNTHTTIKKTGRTAICITLKHCKKWQNYCRCDTQTPLNTCRTDVCITFKHCYNTGIHAVCITLEYCYKTALCWFIKTGLKNIIFLVYWTVNIAGLRLWEPGLDLWGGVAYVSALVWPSSVHWQEASIRIGTCIFLYLNVTSSSNTTQDI